MSMTLEEKISVLKKQGELYLFDDFLGVVLRIVRKDDICEKYLKWKGQKEKRVSIDNETACDIYIDNDSRQVTKEFYEKY